MNFVAPSPSFTTCQCEVAQNVFQRAAEIGQRLVVGVAARKAGLRRAGGEGEQRVAGGGVAVDGDAVERALGRGAQHRLQNCGGQIGVGEHEGQHGRHVGRDHARAFGDADQRDVGSADLRLGVRAFGEGVGGHDGAGGGFEPAGVQSWQPDRPSPRRCARRPGVRR
jgi:hypothetical protein